MIFLQLWRFGMRISRLIAASLLSLCAGCKPWMGLPPPDPIWSAALAAYESSLNDSRLPNVLDAQKAATERARAHLAMSLPASIDDFTKSLQRQNFVCNTYGGSGWECIYSESRPPSACSASFRISIKVDIPYRPDGSRTIISEKDIDIAAGVTDDPHVDNRGCFFFLGL